MTIIDYLLSEIQVLLLVVYFLSMQKIRVLDELTVNQIAAGEVIERPASVVKEILDNAIDAGARRIEIVVENGGLRRILVRDDGCGISESDLPLAIHRHATSKISCLGDIYETGTMGFRGEALASICHVARLTVQSRGEGAESGFEIISDHGEIFGPSPVGHEVGTSVIVEGLFQDVPVRRRYLKSAASEFAAIHKMVLPFVLFFPEIDFVLLQENQEVLNSTGISDQRDLLIQIYGRELKDKLIRIEGERDGVKVLGWVSDGTITFPNRTKMHLAVNRRACSPVILQKIVNDVYRDLIPHRRFPLVLLDVEMPLECVDVNIHPKKDDVKFLSSEMVFSSVPRILKGAMQLGDVVLVPPREDGGAQFAWDGTLKPVQGDGEGRRHDGPVIASLAEDGGLFSAEVIQDSRVASLSFLQVFDTYLVVNAGDALWVLDQHAVHERVLYERFKAEVVAGPIQIQEMLISEMVQVGFELLGVFQEFQERLIALGFEIEVFGVDSLKITGVPLILSGGKVGDWVKGFLEDIREFSGLSDDRPDLKEKLQMKACKAAIKAGKSLQEYEVRKLLEDFLDSPQNFTCPHGRPLFLRYDRGGLDKLFLR